MDRRRIEIRFFDPDLKFIGEEDAYQGLEFISRWTKCGTFKIFVDKLTKQMKVGNYIMLDNDRKKTGIIKRIECHRMRKNPVSRSRSAGIHCYIY